MSANTYWRPTQKGKLLDCLGSFLDVIAEAKDLGRAEGEISLSNEDVPLLRGMAAADKGLRSVVDELIEAIYQHETIYIWREY